MTDKHKSSGGKSTTRLMITKMVLENFKSYAGAQNIGPFHKRFSSVVGPNGSGKSNVIDALLFVFGKRAKQLRLNKVSELIHKSAAFPNLEYANVEVHFQLIVDDEMDDDAFEVVPGSEFIVSRTAFQNNTSKYAVDSRTSNFNDVGLLLRSHGIDLDNNRFLILQGEVEQIAMMEPKGKMIGPDSKVKGEDGLLEYLEDIIGSNKYVEKIEEWSKSLDELNEKRIEKVNRLKVAEKERDNLSGSRSEAEEFLETERNVRRKQNMLYQFNIHESVCIVEDVEGKKAQAAEKLQQEKQRGTEINSKLAESKKDYEDTRAKYDSVCEELERVTFDFNACDRRDIKLREDKKHVATQMKKLESAIVKETKRESDNSKEADKHQKEMVQMKVKIDDLEAQKTAEETKLNEIMSSLQASTMVIREQVEVKQVELGKVQEVAADLIAQKEMVQTQLSLVLSRSEKNTEKLKVAQNRLGQINNELTDLHTKREKFGAAKSDAETNVAKIEKQLVKCVSQEVDAQRGVQSAIMSLEEGKAILQAQSTRTSTVVDALIKAGKKNGPLANAGIRGRLGDLGSIAAEHDVAISTACGMLDHVVVDTVEGGQACLDFVRNNKLGRVSLIVLNQMDSHRKNMEREFVTPATSTRLFDLIQDCSPELMPAFYCALQNTLVVSTLDQALKINSGKVLHRIVSADGNMVESSGAMSGGGKSRKSGAMRLASGRASAVKKEQGSDEVVMTPAKITQLETALEDAQQRLTAIKAEKQALEKSLKEVKAQLKQLEVELEKCNMFAQRLTEQEAETQEAVTKCKQLEKLENGEKAQVQELQAKIAQVDAQIAIACPNLSSLQAEVTALQQSILDVGGPKLKRTQLRISEHSTEIEKLSSVYSAKQVECTNCTQQVTLANKAIAKSQQEVERLQEKLVALDAEFVEMESDAMKLLAAVTSAKALKESQEAYLTQVKVSYEELCEVVNQLKTTEFELKTQLEGHTKTLKERNDSRIGWERELHKVRTAHIEEKEEMKRLLASFMVTGASKKNILLASSSSTVSGSSTASGESAMDVEGEDADADAGNDQDLTDEELQDIPLYTREHLHSRFGSITTAANASKLKQARDDLSQDIKQLEGARDKLKENVNMAALMDYLRKDADYRVRLMELEEITNARNEVRKSYDDCRRHRLEDFMAGFGVITLKLKEMYQMITLGGDAELELVDSLDPFSEGIVFSVRPPKKSWKNISNLSGGEKTLSSLALVFALHHYKPTPLYVMDEIDAALDFKNVSIVANYIKERTKNAQFVIISLRNNMFELADRLVGIYKTYDCTKSVTINPKLFTNCGNIELSDGGANNTGNVNDFKGPSKVK